MSQTDDKERWWKTTHLEENQGQTWNFGCLELNILRLMHEWQVRFNHTNVALEEEQDHVTTKFENQNLTRFKALKRFVVARTQSQIIITPVLPDRNIVVKPFDRIMLLPDEHVTLYISIVLWFRICTGHNRVLLCQIPIRALSDTWFGPNTQLGQLCYASKTRAVINKNLISIKPYRAIIPVTIVNNQSHMLSIEKINIPAPTLELRQNQEGLLWTTGITLIQTKSKSEIKLADPKNEYSTRFSQWELINAAETPLEEGLISKAYNVFFS
ncbi:hypothetical protein [Zooshikella harenae]|uniref:DUF432 domain-containing protein n=1 Tax=Zooshikella harenae TaxID=2827238 RepID=A0ABS5ZGG4_9GAMM|nr:hypothetical protein [Zooshikella harenae]MBU2713139.1 hypothetical protein [Zooshikella harenae]